MKFLYEVLFCFKSIQQVNARYKMNEKVNKFLLAGDKFMSEMCLGQLGFTFSAYGPVTINKKGIKKFKETGDSKYIHQEESDKCCFQHNMSYEEFKVSNRRTFADKLLQNKTFNIAKDPKFDGYQHGLISMVYKFLKKNSGSGIKNENISNSARITQIIY